METEQMTARLLAEIRTNREEMKTNQEVLTAGLEAKMDPYQEDMKAMFESYLEKTEGRKETGQEQRGVIIKTDMEDMKATESVANRDEIETVVEHHKSLRKRPQWRLSGQWRFDMGRGVWL
jgi:hypothetical protein